MAELDPSIEHASDELVAAAYERASNEFRPSVMSVMCNHMLAILARLRKAERERDELREYAHAATIALTEDVIGGGSECFSGKIGEMYKADIPFCVARFRERQERLHDQISTNRKTETDNANMARLLSGYHQICREAGIAPATSEIYAAAERLTERAEKAERERDEAKEIAIAGFGIHAARYAADFGLPDGHLFAQHYDTLAKLGARMDSFIRSPIRDYAAAERARGEK